jgi:SAM-dependent methyltransferase
MNPPPTVHPDQHQSPAPSPSQAPQPVDTPDFNRLAGLYRWMELACFGPWLWWCRCAFLPELQGRRQALVLGEGDGRFTARLLRENSRIHIDAIDASSAMLQALARRAAPHAAEHLGSSRLRTHCADARNWKPGSLQGIFPTAQPYDLIVTHFFLDCLTTEEVQALATKLHRVVSPSALWLVSEFAIPPNLFGRLIAHPIVSGLYWAFSRLTGLTVRHLPDHAAALSASGFTLVQHRTWLGGLLRSELWSALPPRPIVASTPAKAIA